MMKSAVRLAERIARLMVALLYAVKAYVGEQPAMQMAKKRRSEWTGAVAKRMDRCSGETTYHA